jgi:hypothetical protein
VRLGPDGQPLPMPPREARGPQGAPDQQGQQQPPREPRLGPDGQPLPPRPRRERKPIGPDANGLGPDGTPWDPERRTKRRAERDPQHGPGAEGAMNADPGAPVEGGTPPAQIEPAPDATPKE